MKRTRLILSLSGAITLLAAQLAIAGTLDDAPFRVVPASSGWTIDDSKAQPMGKDVFLVATLSNTNTMLKSVVIKTVLKKVSASSLEELCAGIRDSFSNPAVKNISEADTTFLDRKAKTFIFEINQGGQTTYSEATVFVADGKGWTVDCVGRPNQKDEIKKIFGFYQKKAGIK